MAIGHVGDPHADEILGSRYNLSKRELQTTDTDLCDDVNARFELWSFMDSREGHSQRSPHGRKSCVPGWIYDSSCDGQGDEVIY